MTATFITTTDRKAIKRMLNPTTCDNCREIFEADGMPETFTASDGRKWDRVLYCDGYTDGESCQEGQVKYTRPVVCGECNGRGSHEDGRCWNCDGSGMVEITDFRTCEDCRGDFRKGICDECLPAYDHN